MASFSKQIWQLRPAMSDTEALSQYVVAGVLKEKETSIEIRKLWQTQCRLLWRLQTDQLAKIDATSMTPKSGSRSKQPLRRQFGGSKALEMSWAPAEPTPSLTKHSYDIALESQRNWLEYVHYVK